MADAGVLDFSLEPEGPREVGLLFARKNGRRFRLVINARSSNLGLARPPGVELCAGAALARVELGADEVLYAGGVDMA
eukprot:11194653-Lingulodinium_polyedra.AAC.1